MLSGMSSARGTFEIVMSSRSPELDGDVDRFDFTKTFHGDLDAAGTGMMLSSGNPQAGEAGYVAIETVHRPGGYAIVPGSGHGELNGITGIFHLTIEDDGTHRYELDYEI
jgi:hypothetical protein